MILILLFLFSSIASSKTIFIEAGTEIENLEQAALLSTAGDSIIFRDGIYSGGMSLQNWGGIEDSPIFIMAENTGMVSIEGGNTAIHFIDCNNIVLSGIVFKGQITNGLNIDDGGSFESPSRGWIISSCTFSDMNASGNNDLIKMSGVNNFLIQDCLFQNGSVGGSGIDMVGCHFGEISESVFRDVGGNSVQGKGGTHDISIQRNLFINGGARTLNLGGSTGMQFFRPIDAPFEARRLKVQANIFIGSPAPITFIGSDSVIVSNNNIVLPDKWVMRILQENNHERLIQCGDNVFANNIIYVNSDVNVTANIGPNTRSETFIFESNNWYNVDDSSWQPNLPSEDLSPTYFDPGFIGGENDEKPYYPEGMKSDATGNLEYTPELDFTRVKYNVEPSIGAYELNLIIDGISDDRITKKMIVVGEYLQIDNNKLLGKDFQIFNSNGKMLKTGAFTTRIEISDLGAGVYLFMLAGEPSHSFVFLKE